MILHICCICLHLLYICKKKNKKISQLLKKKNVIFYKNFLDLNNKISKLKVNFVIHCATHYVKNHKISDLQKLSDSNILFGNIILENVEKMKVSKFIFHQSQWLKFDSNQSKMMKNHSRHV